MPGKLMLRKLMVGKLFGGNGSDNLRYLLRDQYTTDVAAGSVEGSLATDGTNTRKVTDAENKLSITGGKAVFTPKTVVANGNPGMWYKAFSRRAGQMIFYRVNPSTSSCYVGWHSAQSGQPLREAVAFDSSGRWRYDNNNAAGPYVRTAVISKPYDLSIIQRAAGAFLFALNATPRLQYVGFSDTTANLYPAISEYNSTALAVDEVNIPDALWLPSPILSDGFSAAASDGAGHAEATGLGAGGAGITWTDAVGAFAAAGGVLTCTALDTGVAVRTAALSTPHIWIECDLTRSAGVAGLVFRWTDAANYMRVVHDGTNIVFTQVVGGTETVIVSQAATYATGAKLAVKMDGSYFRVYYNKAWIGAEYVVMDEVLQGANKAGVYTTDAANTWDNLAVWALGNEGQYTNLFRYLPQANHRNILLIGDSKTASYSYPQENLTTDAVRIFETHPRLGRVGWTVANWAAVIATHLAAVGYAPDVVFSNLGVNDINGGLPVEATWKADYQTIINAIHSRFPSAKIYLTYFWKRGQDADCDTVAGWIDALIAANPGVVFASDNERVWLKGADDGATMSTDGVHYSTAGKAEWLVQKRAVLGY